MKSQLPLILSCLFIGVLFGVLWTLYSEKTKFESLPCSVKCWSKEGGLWCPNNKGACYGGSIRAGMDFDFPSPKKGGNKTPSKPERACEQGGTIMPGESCYIDTEIDIKPAANPPQPKVWPQPSGD